MLIEFEGQRIEVPDDATDAEIAGILGGPAQNAAPGGKSFSDTVKALAGQPETFTPAPEAAPEGPGMASRAADYAMGTGAVGLQEARRGAGDVLGMPVDAVNSLPRLVGLPPFSKRPLGGSEDMNMIGDALPKLLSAIFGGNSEAVPQDAFQRVVGRMGREVGMTAVPVGGAIHKAGEFTGKFAPKIIDQAGPLTQFFVKPAVVNPGGLAAKEGIYATGAGAGAGAANEMVGNPQKGENFWSDLIGSIFGTVGTAVTGKVFGAGRNAIATVAGRPGIMDDVAGQEVTDRIINNSTTLADQFQRTGQIDTSPLVDQLRRKSRVEELVPGYQANIGDRSQDPALMTEVFNQDARVAGPANTRRTANETAVENKMTAIAPQGDPAQFRAALDANRDAQIAEAIARTDTARSGYETAAQSVQPGMREASARGSSVRAGLQDAYDTGRSQVEQLYAPVNQAQQPVDVSPLRDRFATIDQNLPLNDRQRFRPSEANVPAQLAPEAPPAPVPTGILDVNEKPIMRQPQAPDPTVPLNEVTAMRTGLTDDIRAQRAGRQDQAARVGTQYREAIDQFVDESVPPELRGTLEQARAARRDLADRFERPGTAHANTLRQREGGGYAVDDSAVAGQYAQTDQGRLSDLRSLLREAGQDTRVRDGLADEVLSDVQSRGLIDRPDQLRRYLDDRSVLLSEFPELRTRLEQAGAARTTLAEAERGATETQKRLTTPGRSAQASYLKFDNEATVDAVRNLTSGPKSREATRELLAAAGDTPEARSNAKSAFWKLVQGEKMQAAGMTGTERWNYKKLKAIFEDPKKNAVAEELWSDNPSELADIKELFGALAGSEGSGRARAVGSSGTPQALSGKFDPAMSMSSLASRARSVNRGQLSPTIAIVDVASTWLRNRSKAVQSRAIDTLTSAAFNNPGLAADLLEKFNPANVAARRQMILQKYGVRATQLVNLLDEIQGSDDTRDAVMRK